MIQERTSEKNEPILAIELRNPALAGFLAWLCPGAGHLYQRRYFKAAIFGISVWCLMVMGLAMGTYRAPADDSNSSGTLQFARTVYCSWRPGDRRLAFVPQACVGVMAIPALHQARAHADSDGTFWTTAFAPPRIASESATRPGQPTLDELAANLYSWLDLSTFYTIAAGLLNLLAIFDAIGGPTLTRDEPKKKSAKKAESSKEPV